MGKKLRRRTIVFDFDGVIHRGYEGYKDGSIYGEIDYKLLEFIGRLMDNGFYVVISSNRPAKQIVEFLNNDNNTDLKFEVYEKDFGDNLYWEKEGIVGVTNAKAVGTIYIDDRGYRYKGLEDLEDNLFINIK